MRFLVTGGAGFIGSHISEYLLNEGHAVRVLDNFSSGKMDNLLFSEKEPLKSKFELLRGDIRDAQACEKACESIEYVLHQAALRSVPKSMKEPESYNDVNIGGTLNLLKAAAKARVKRVVFASSSSVYGDVSRFPEREDFYPQLISPYALSKLAGEYYCRIFSAHFGVETVGLRYFNVFGPRQALDDEYAVVIPKFIHCILNGEQPPVYGTGKQSRDFTYIDNVVQANFLAATVPGISHAVINVANGRDTTVLRIVDLLNAIIGCKIKPVFLPPRPGDVFRTCADISRARKLIGFRPRLGFEEGLKRTVAWFRQKEARRQALVK